ncbi:MAG: hypothetical protein MHM6MM_008903 [Cercozoa sp. M6MM]
MFLTRAVTRRGLQRRLLAKKVKKGKGGGGGAAAAGGPVEAIPPPPEVVPESWTHNDLDPLQRFYPGLDTYHPEMDSEDVKDVDLSFAVVRKGAPAPKPMRDCDYPAWLWDMAGLPKSTIELGSTPYAKQTPFVRKKLAKYMKRQVLREQNDGRKLREMDDTLPPGWDLEELRVENRPDTIEKRRQRMRKRLQHGAIRLNPLVDIGKLEDLLEEGETLEELLGNYREARRNFEETRAAKLASGELVKKKKSKRQRV